MPRGQGSAGDDAFARRDRAATIGFMAIALVAAALLVGGGLIADRVLDLLEAQAACR